MTDTKAERREKRRKNARKMKVSGHSSVRIWVELHQPRRKK